MKTDELVNLVNETMGRKVAWQASDKSVDYQIPSGLPTLDTALGGGFPRGIPIILQGLPGTGKSSLAYRLAGQATKALKLPTLLIQAEGPFELCQQWAMKCGFPKDNVVICTANLEEALALIRDILPTGTIGALIVDSLASLKPQDILEAKPGDKKSYGRKAVMLNAFFNSLPNFLAKPYPLMLFLQHLYQSPSQRGGIIWKMSGGMAQEYLAGLILRLSRSSEVERSLKMEGGKIDDITCLEIIWRIEKTKIGGKFHDTGIYRLYLADDIFPAGSFSDHIQVIQLGIVAGVIKKSGSWFTYHDKKYHGMDELIKAIDVEECVTSYAKQLKEERNSLRAKTG